MFISSGQQIITKYSITMGWPLKAASRPLAIWTRRPLSIRTCTNKTPSVCWGLLLWKLQSLHIKRQFCKGRVLLWIHKVSVLKLWPWSIPRLEARKTSIVVGCLQYRYYILSRLISLLPWSCLRIREVRWQTRKLKVQNPSNWSHNQMIFIQGRSDKQRCN